MSCPNNSAGSFKCIAWLQLLLLTLALSACGGGDSTDTPSSPPVPPPAPSSFVNYVPILVNAGALGQAVNMPFVSVTLCEPGTERCQTIDHILVDTGSTGLRLLSSAVDPLLNLPAIRTASEQALGECYSFVSGSTWGAVVMADLKMGDEIASQLPIQIINPANFSSAPSACSGQGRLITAFDKLEFNGILGINTEIQDCGDSCVTNPSVGYYWSCSAGTAGSCQPQIVGLSQQIRNPVAAFARDNNGTLIQLPSVPDNGEQQISGTLYFGIGTRSNNGLGSANIYTMRADGTLTTYYKGQALTGSFIDSGSGTYSFDDPEIVSCSSSVYYCSALQTLSAVIEGQNGNHVPITFKVGNADSMFATGYSAYSTLASPWDNHTVFGFSRFGWGLPFFFGRSVYTAIKGKTTQRDFRPYVAF